jgi:hypothetical protein
MTFLHERTRPATGTTRPAAATRARRLWAKRPPGCNPSFRVPFVCDLIFRGEPFTRLGPPLSESKGAALLRSMFKGRDETLDGEWVQKEGKYYAFDLPDQPGDLDERFRALCRLAIFKTPGVALLESYGGHFARIYGTLPRETTEGVVFKRRSSSYAKQRRASAETRDWLKRRFVWD